MGVKSTETLSREEADERYIHYYVTYCRIQRARDFQKELESGSIREHSQDTIETFLRVDADIKTAGWTMEAWRFLVGITNTELENELERLKDHISGGEGFENYIITD